MNDDAGDREDGDLGQQHLALPEPVGQLGDVRAEHRVPDRPGPGDGPALGRTGRSAMRSAARCRARTWTSTSGRRSRCAGTRARPACAAGSDRGSGGVTVLCPARPPVSFLANLPSRPYRDGPGGLSTRGRVSATRRCSRPQPDLLGYSKSIMRPLPRLGRSLTGAPWRRSRRSVADLGRCRHRRVGDDHRGSWLASDRQQARPGQHGRREVAAPGAGKTALTTDQVIASRHCRS